MCIQSGQKEPIDVLVNTEHKKQLERYRVVINAVTQTIILLGRQGLALRGHDETGTSSNPGNFLVFLNNRCEFDKDLNTAMTEMKKNAQYTSPQIQNELIEIIGKEILIGIKKKVAKASFFTVLADEATDCTMTQQLVILLRYLDRDEDGAMFNFPWRFLLMPAYPYSQHWETLASIKQFLHLTRTSYRPYV